MAWKVQDSSGRAKGAISAYGWNILSATGSGLVLVDHGALSGLSDDDHPQYLLVANIDDGPVNGETAAPISSNWAFDHEAAANPHTGYLLESVADAKGDLMVASADNIIDNLTVGANDTILVADSAQTLGVKWAAAAIVNTILSPAWTSHAPTATASVGTFTTVAVTGAYQQVGKTVHWRGLVTITTNNTAAGFIIVPAPVTAVAARGIGAAKETSTGVACTAEMYQTGNIKLVTAAGLYPGADGFTIQFSITYEAA